MDKIKKAIIFKGLPYTGIADLCTCPHCENVMGEMDNVAMLVPAGMARCPHCGEQLMWYSEDTIDEDKEASMYDIVTDNDIELFEYVANYKEVTNEEVEKSLNYDMLTDAEKAAIDEFVGKVDLTDTTQLLQ